MTTLAESIGNDLRGFGGFLRCEQCGHVWTGALDTGRFIAHGWPKHCGYTMRWWTQRQIDAGEVPAQ